MKTWSQNKKVYDDTLRKRMALSFGDFKTEGQIREDLLKAIRACDEARIARVKAPGYDSRQTMEVLKRHGIYRYTTDSIAERRSVIEHQLGIMVPKTELDAVKGEIFGALKVEKAGVNLEKLSPAHKVMLRDSGLADYMDLVV